ncbi:MAG: hypothetical protein QW400_02970 [Candidatus Diapherotrites archaeon]
MEAMSRGQIISVILLSVHFLLFAFLGAFFVFTGPFFYSIRPGHELWGQMVKQLESNPEFMRLIENEGVSAESFLIENLPLLGTAFIFIGLFMVIIAVLSILSAIFIYKGKNWARYLGLVSVIFGMLIPGFLAFLSIPGLFLLLMAFIVIYFLFFDKETVAVFSKESSSAALSKVDDNSQEKAKGKLK